MYFKLGTSTQFIPKCGCISDSCEDYWGIAFAQPLANHGLSNSDLSSVSIGIGRFLTLSTCNVLTVQLTIIYYNVIALAIGPCDCSWGFIRLSKLCGASGEDINLPESLVPFVTGSRQQLLSLFSSILWKRMRTISEIASFLALSRRNKRKEA